MKLNLWYKRPADLAGLFYATQKWIPALLALSVTRKWWGLSNKR